jgi:2-amino-4-hydroxy-6-hydroxymethyldihydropteridine diphosphokinase
MPEPGPKTEIFAVVALGSNLGNSREILQAALAELRLLDGKGFRASSFHRTTPVDCPPGSPDFLNAVAIFHPGAGETPESLLKKLQRLEREHGRVPKKVENEARPLDLDLIAFGTERRNAPDLILPHPRAAQRRFVLEPLAEIAPGLILPGQDRTVVELLKLVR